jgi:hypothetical protein
LGHSDITVFGVCSLFGLGMESSEVQWPEVVGSLMLRFDLDLWQLPVRYLIYACSKSVSACQR